jgi:hypothetical protein
MIRALVFSLLSTAALAACASTPSHPPSRSASAALPAGCSTTESRIARPESSGCYSPSRVYSQKDMRQTGKTDVAHALQMLDPSITVHGN